MQYKKRKAMKTSKYRKKNRESHFVTYGNLADFGGIYDLVNSSDFSDHGRLQ